MGMSASTPAFCPPWLNRSVTAEQWWELEQDLNDLLELNPYGEEPGERWGGMHTALREAFLRISANPDLILRWLDRGGDELVLCLGDEPCPFTLETFDAYRQSQVAERICLLLDRWGVLAPTEEDLAPSFMDRIMESVERRVGAAIARRVDGVSLPEICFRHFEEERATKARPDSGRSNTGACA